MQRGLKLYRVVLAAIVAAVSLAQPVEAQTSDEPPLARMEGRDGSRQAGTSTFCWRRQDGQRICGDSFGLFAPSSGFLPVKTGELLRFGVPVDREPYFVRFRVWAIPIETIPMQTIQEEDAVPVVTRTPFAPSLTPSWQADLSPGKYLISIHWFWGTQEEPDEDAQYFFGIRVKPSPSKPLPRSGVSSYHTLGGFLLAIAAVLVRRLRIRDQLLRR